MAHGIVEYEINVKAILKKIMECAQGTNYDNYFHQGLGYFLVSPEEYQAIVYWFNTELHGRTYYDPPGIEYAKYCNIEIRPNQFISSRWKIKGSKFISYYDVVE